MSGLVLASFLMEQSPRLSPGQATDREADAHYQHQRRARRWKDGRALIALDLPQRGQAIPYTQTKSRKQRQQSASILEMTCWLSRRYSPQNNIFRVRRFAIANGHGGTNPFV